MACNTKITANLLFDCADAPKKGLDGGKAVILNYDDVDFSALTQTGATVTNLATSAVGFEVQWYKELASVASAFTANSEDVDGFSHQFLARLATTSAESAERAEELKNGRYIVVVETSYKGANQEDAFKIYGLDAGLELQELSGNSDENSGSLLFTLGTREGTVERYPYNVLLETNYVTTKASFDSLFNPI